MSGKERGRVPERRAEKYLPRLVIHDRLYRDIEVSDIDLAIFQTPEMVRLRDVSLSNGPSCLTTFSSLSNRFEHSVGVGYLPNFLHHTFDREQRDLLHYAGLLHDIATPPFSHLSEHFLTELTGKDHEQFIDDFLAGSEIEKIIEKDGVSFKDVKRIVKGCRFDRS
jgi:HD superfamily phosphohydrolase